MNVYVHEDSSIPEHYINMHVYTALAPIQEYVSQESEHVEFER